MAVTEVSWLRPGAPDEIRQFWEIEYPAMSTLEGNVQKIEAAGYKVVGHFVLPESGWMENYYKPLEKRLEMLSEKYKGDDAAYSQIEASYMEIEMFRKYSAWYGYIFYLMQVEDS